MSHPTSKKKQRAWILISFLALASAVGAAAYLRYAHSLIQAIYEGRSIPFLNSLIEGQGTFPLEVYLKTADGMFLAFLAALSLVTGLALLLSLKRPLSPRLQWTLAAFLVFLIVCLRYFLPALGENEAVYLVGPKKWLNPAFLAQDWIWQERQYSHFLFELLACPFYFFLPPLGLVLVGRLLVWSLLIGAFIRLARTIGIGWWEFVLAFAFWLYAEQSLAAGDWVFGGVEAKCFSYFFLVMALRSLLNQEALKSAIYAGLAVSFHVVVGGWGALAIWAASLGSRHEAFFKKAVLFPLLVLLFALPGVLPGVYSFFRTGGMTWEDYEIHVFFRSPHHLDPRYFLSGAGAVEVVLIYLLTLVVLGKSFKREHARILSIFLTALIGFFALGLAAREQGYLPFLLTEPCRVGAVFLLLLFFISAAHFLKNHIRSKHLFHRGLAALILGMLAFDFFRYAIPEKFLKQTGAFITSWKDHIEGQSEDNFGDMAGWIKAHTAEDSTLIAPPWEDRFWLLAERAQVVSYKYVLHNALIKEWRSRLIELNGGRPFQGKRILDELKENYVSLTKDQLLQLKTKYRALYYLTTRRRPDLPFSLLYSNGTYYLYDLRG